MNSSPNTNHPEYTLTALVRVTLKQDKSRILFITMNDPDALDLESIETKDFEFTLMREFKVPVGRINRSDELELYKSSLQNKIINEMRSLKSFYRVLEFTDLTTNEQSIARLSSTLGKGTEFSTDFFVERKTSKSKVPEIKGTKTQKKAIIKEAQKLGRQTKHYSDEERLEMAERAKQRKHKASKGGRKKGSKNVKPRVTKAFNQRIVIIDLLGNVQARELSGQIHSTLSELKIPRARYDESRIKAKKLEIRELPLLADITKWTELWKMKKAHYTGWRIYMLQDFIDITGINPYDDYDEGSLHLNLRVNFKMDQGSIDVLRVMGREPMRRDKNVPEEMIYD